MITQGDKTRAASFLNGFKNIPGKRVSIEFITMMLLCTLEISIRENIKLLHVMFYRPFDRSIGL